MKTPSDGGSISRRGADSGYRQVPEVPALQASGQLGHLGPGTLPLRRWNWVRSPGAIRVLTSSRSKIAQGRVPRVPQVSVARLFPFEAWNWVRSAGPTRTPPTPGNFASHLLP